jgi:protein-disulfide isomerase
LLWVLAVGCGGTPVHVLAPSVARPAPTGPPPIAPDLPSPPALSEEDAAVPVSLGNPTWGSRTALVTIVEYADFECPFCARAEATLSRIRETYGPETVRIVWKNSPLPFHRGAKGAAEAAAGVFALAGSEAFWRFHDGVLHARGPLRLTFYEQMAKEAGVSNMSAYLAGLSRHAWADAVERDMTEGEELGVFGTPTFFINGVPLTGALPFPTFQGVIERQIRAARAKLAGGTEPERVYKELTQDNRAAFDKADDDDHDEADAAEMK